MRMSFLIFKEHYTLSTGWTQISKRPELQLTNSISLNIEGRTRLYSQNKFGN